MRNKSEATKRRLKMGTGTGKEYKPYIQAGEFGSVGTASCPVDWKTGRVVHLMSQAELYVWYLLRWDDDVVDIREQFPLDKSITIALAKELGIKHPQKNGKPITMTTDLLVTKTDGEIAVSVKNSLDDIKNSNRTIEKIYLEKLYWNLKGIPFKVMTKENVNIQTVNNIRDVVHHYNAKNFADEITFAKHLIARKCIAVDMDSKINYQEVIKGEEFKKWIKKALE